jgi:hypothetical protein
MPNIEVTSTSDRVIISKTDESGNPVDNFGNNGSAGNWR